VRGGAVQVNWRAYQTDLGPVPRPALVRMRSIDLELWRFARARSRRWAVLIWVGLVLGGAAFAFVAFSVP
jgi:hypothetical protein